MQATPYRDERLPRYTSYPTAPHFGTDVDAQSYEGWLRQLPVGTTTSLYLHVPFCRSMCWYCGCHTTVALRDGPIVDYLAALRSEIGLVAEQLSAPVDVRHVHFGGGTPTILEPADFVALVALLRQRFAIHPRAEIAVEIDPRRLGPAMTAALAAAGVNRASLGVQSFDPAVQKAINRIQSVEQTATVVTGLRGAGITAVSFDLIYGLPKQTLQSCLDTVEQCLAMKPDRFSIFGYAHVPEFKKHQRRIATADLPDGEARHVQAQAMAETLAAAGYVRIGLDHFARPDDPMAMALSQGRLRRNFQGYTTDPCEALIGFGASAIGRLPQGYVQNEVVIGRYAEHIADGALPVAKGYRLSAEDRLRAELIERVMCDLSVDIDAVRAQYSVAPEVLVPALRKLDQLAREGVIDFDGSRVLLPENARLFVRKVASVFDAHLDQPPRKYSRAV
ncbi:Oxygen-independent coproporphyrinogen III oxidase [Bosea sp. 62]|jgi:oxygen-independent coproporphyrinogen-3 oxidase|uniref:Coproporphyrinogen-III oxidase n=1 Tax=Bosea vestrisii TaxID=151416 RepID=A0ABW0HAU0_9HYPH|nr:MULTISPECIES: oxygen-independent coproporphyrinogen III oxidase [unclassified Bosea (in: a-proteobacteria)]CAD5294268.1 Oxygen-independent coproporphyrinogen III oxidase [Bosea sp. 21B]CAD5294833.1 Oxygen-independent coproporphyrinogen III oxidase [Bosea sp. 46]CAD5298819.1 Oxygen-independent coproporphyrinogen III oxidase [Bosea sp. 7B]VVT60860.1 Oxygen-independent coproporphyrinogen III oxidase [Bosea sp. EC-HK365B]VXB38510.1 Oxygen-independent coproporphyrinogen III oxidase [Bosea sp. 12